jgi:hypothetical protein
MIITRVTGGLGNQLFQYAAGTSLALRLNTALKLDLSLYGEKGMRQFELDKFHTNYREATNEESAPFKNLSVIHRAFYRLRPAYKRPVYKQPGFGFDPHFTEAGDGIYLKGYWQSWKYFEPVEQTIREHFRLRDEHIARVKDLAASLRNSDTISVHIRRGDYKTPEALAYHGLLPAAYYNEALKRMGDLYPGARLLFFSDDIAWVEKNIHTDLPHEFVTGRLSETALEDFHLMQHCRHHIIANSSFSWWAAWLNPLPDKTVIAPRQWFASTRNETRDIIPPDWLRI